MDRLAPHDAAASHPVNSGGGAWPWLAGGALAAAVLASLVAVLPSWSTPVLVIVLAAFFAPGVALGWRLYRAEPSRLLLAILFGPATGYVLSSLILLALWTAGIRSPALLLVAPVVATALAWPLGSLAGRLSVPRVGRRDLVALFLVLLLVPLVVGRPYARVGQQVPDGRAYRAYFTADFVWAMAVVAEVSKGDVPPRNMFFRGDDLRYYWLAHLLPAVEHRVFPAVTVEKVLLVNDVVIGLAFAAFLYLFVRHFVSSPAAAAAGCAGGVLFSSFEGTAYLWSLWRIGRSFEAARYVNIDAISRWVYQSMPVDGLHRLVLYQPQHELGYMLGFSALLLVVEARDRLRAGVLFLAGLILGMSILLSSFAAVMLTLIVALYAGIALAWRRQWGVMVAGGAAAALPMFGALALSRALRYIDTGGSLVAFGLNRTATHRAAIAIFLSFGPMLIAAAAGVAFAAWRRALTRFAVLLVAIAVCWLFYFYVDVPEHQHVYVGWRAANLLFIVFTALAGYWLQEGWAAGGWVRRATASSALLLALAAAPMVVIDLYNTQDTSNRGEAPGFHWTVVLTPDEVEALEWIKRSTPPSALVQVEPEVRGRETWAYIPAFAERRMAAGLPISMIPLQKYEAASAAIKQIYLAGTAAQAQALASAACIDYLVVAPPERAAYPALQPLLDANPEYFPPAFRNASVAVYSVTSQPSSCSQK